jgi:hypothetical protein
MGHDHGHGQGRLGSSRATSGPAWPPRARPGHLGFGQAGGLSAIAAFLLASTPMSMLDLGAFVAIDVKEATA